MQEYSETAWNIASKYSHVLASETRYLAAWIDDAMKKERAEIERLTAALKLYANEANYSEQIGQGGTDPAWIMVDRGRIARKMLSIDEQELKPEK